MKIQNFPTLASHRNKQQQIIDSTTAEIADIDRYLAQRNRTLAAEREAENPLRNGIAQAVEKQPINTLEQYIARHIALGGRLRMTDQYTNGLAAELGITPGSQEHRELLSILSNNEGMTPEQLAQDISENIEPEYRHLINGRDTQDIRNAIIDTIAGGVTSRRRAYDFIADINQRATDEEQRYIDEQELQAEIDADTEAAIRDYEELLLSSLTPHDLAIIDAMAGDYWDELLDIQQYEQEAYNDYDTPSTSTAPRNTQQGAESTAIQSSTQPSDTTPISQDSQDTATIRPATPQPNDNGTTRQDVVDNQGNPIDTGGNLIIEPVASIDEITDQDFETPTRTIALPTLPENVSNAIGSNGRQVIIKKNVFEKNHKNHKDLSPANSREILKQTLFNPNLYGQNQKASRPYNWILIHLADPNTAVIIEVNENKENVEIVNWHYLRGESLEMKKKQAIKEGGLILTLESAVGNTLDSSSTHKGTSSSSQSQEINEEINKKVAQAEAEVNTNPTEAQKEAGNYKKGHIRLGAFDITIEQPQGSIRRGVDANGKAWESKMHNTYGYIRGTEGVDGDHIDVFLANDMDSWNGEQVFVIDQYNEDGTFDEHKVMLGFNDIDQAYQAYLSNYKKGWEKKHNIVTTATTTDDFNKWIDSSHRKTKPFADYKTVKTTAGQATPAESTTDRRDTTLVSPEPSQAHNTKEQQAKLAHIASWQQAIDVPIVIFHDISEVDNPQAVANIQAGNRTPGWFTDGTVYIYLPHILDARDIDETIMHECIAHYGIPRLFATQQQADAFYDEVWNAMPEADQFRFLRYPGVSHLKGNEARRAAADEYIAHLAEQIRAKRAGEAEVSLWQRIVSFFRNALRRANVNLRLNDTDLTQLLLQSLDALKKNNEQPQETNYNANTQLRSAGIKVAPDEYAKIAHNIATYPNKVERGHVFTDNYYYLCTNIDNDGNFNIIAQLPIEGNEELINKLRGKDGQRNFKALERTEDIASTIKEVKRRGGRTYRNIPSSQRQTRVDGRNDNIHLGQQPHTASNQRPLDRDDDSTTRFRVANQNQAIFVSNARQAVENIRQDRATPEQWLAMLQKNGGIKAGEDRWLGLSDWLKNYSPSVSRSDIGGVAESRGGSNTITRQQILDFINSNAIRIEEVHYTDRSEDELWEDFKSSTEGSEAINAQLYEDADEWVSANINPQDYNDEEEYEVARNNAIEDYIEDDLYGRNFDRAEQKVREAWEQGDLGEYTNPINSTRLDYTTPGLENNHEIALTIPDIEPYNEYDDVHFGDAGGGRAVAWIRFGDTRLTQRTPINRKAVISEKKHNDFGGDYYTIADNPKDFISHRLLKDGRMVFLPSVNGKYIGDTLDTAVFDTLNEAVAALQQYYDANPIYRNTSINVLVIDEIQSKRHQDGREKGYRNREELIHQQQAEEEVRTATREFNALRNNLKEKYDYNNIEGSPLQRARLFLEKMSDEDRAQFNQLLERKQQAERVLQAMREPQLRIEDIQFTEHDGIIEGRYGDITSRFVEGTPRQAILQNIQEQLRTHRISDARRLVPDAPFDKNWHELAFKRMLRYAAENGYDHLAWTTGTQQAERYDIGNTVHAINRDETGILAETSSGDISIDFDSEGNITTGQFSGNTLTEVFGKETAVKILNMTPGQTLSGDNLRIGGEGMKAFYDRMLPSFVSKYVKKWGSKVQDITLPELGDASQSDGLTMHSVEITPDMRESVMQGQTMFRSIRPDESLTDYARAVVANNQQSTAPADNNTSLPQNLKDRFSFRSSSEIEAEYPNWLDGTTTDSGKHSTQVEGTRKTYNKVADWIEQNIGKDVAILDASSGMGYGTADLRARGFNIEDVEPYQSDERRQNNPATYDSYDKIDKQYDYIISNAVLNVIPDDWRAGVLHDMATQLKPGGRIFINTRKAGEEKHIKDKIELDSPQEVLVKRNGRIASYQRFFTPAELREWVQQELGEGYTVEIANKANSGTSGLAAVVVTKNNENTSTRFRSASPLDTAQQVARQALPRRIEQHTAVLAKRLGVPITVLHSNDALRPLGPDFNDLADWLDGNIDGHTHRMAGMFDAQSNKLFIFAHNIARTTDPIAELESTITHEVVAHYGLRQLLGEQRLKTLLSDTWSAMPQELQLRWGKYAMNLKRTDTLSPKQLATLYSSPAIQHKAAEEYIAHISESGVAEPTLWQHICATFRRLLRRIGLYSYRPTEADIRYILSQSYSYLTNKSHNNQQSPAALNGSASTPDTRFRTFGGNSGYVGYSMSKRAEQAREEGRYPKTDFKKIYGITDKMLTALVESGIVSNNEWHHTSKFGNKTTFYGFENQGAIDFFNENKDRVKEAIKNGTVKDLLPEFEQAATAYEEEELRIFQEKQIENELRNKYKEYINSYIPDDYTTSKGLRVVKEGYTIAVYKDGERLTKRHGRVSRDTAREEYNNHIKQIKANLPSFEEWQAAVNNKTSFRTIAADNRTADTALDTIEQATAEYAQYLDNQRQDIIDAITPAPDDSPTTVARKVMFRSIGGELVTRDNTELEKFLSDANRINNAIAENDARHKHTTIAEAHYDSMQRLHNLIEDLRKQGALIDERFDPWLTQNQSRSRAQADSITALSADKDTTNNPNTQTRNCFFSPSASDSATGKSFKGKGLKFLSRRATTLVARASLEAMYIQM